MDFNEKAREHFDIKKNHRNELARKYQQRRARKDCDPLDKNEETNISRASAAKGLSRRGYWIQSLHSKTPTRKAFEEYLRKPKRPQGRSKRLRCKPRGMI